MQIIGKDGQKVELRISGYEYTNDFDNEWDANWLRIYVNVKSNVGQWQTVDASLLTWEFKQLIEWFRDLSHDKEFVETEMAFIEPNLTFKLIDTLQEIKTIQIKFDYETRPQSFDDEKEYFINFQLSKYELATIANAVFKG